MQPKLEDIIATVEDQHQLLEELAALEESLYKTNEGKWEETLNSKVRPEVAEIIVREIVNAGNDKKKYLREMIDAVKQMKTMKITLAFAPTTNLVNNITKWIKLALGAGIILKIDIDKNILGGARIAFDGKYYDGSLKQKWENTWQEKGKEFLKQFNYG